MDALATWVRESAWAYPAANVVHVLAVLIFFASVAALHLGLLRLRPAAVLAFGVIVASGLALFVPEAAGVAANPAFQLKVLLIGTAIANAALGTWAYGRSTPLVRNTAVASVLLWLCVAAAGRMIAYV